MTLQRHDGEDADMPKLAKLDDLDGYRIPKDEPNPKGWAVVTADGRKVGEVDGLIVDTSAMTVRYLDCDLDRKKLGFDEDRERHVLIPMNRTHLDTDGEQVHVDGLTVDRIRDLPVFGGLPISSDFDDRLRNSFRDSGGQELHSADERDRFYDEQRSAAEERPLADTGRNADLRASDEDRMRRDADEAAEPTVRSRSADTAASDSGDRTAEKEIRIRVRGDEIIVEKRPLD